jgi:hypothetical protein
VNAQSRGTTKRMEERGQMLVRTRTRGMLATLVVAVAVMVSLVSAVPVAATPDDFGLRESTATLSTAQAGAHADFETKFRIYGDPTRPAGSLGQQNSPWASARNILVELPPGLLGNPSAFPTCSNQVFVEQLRDPSQGIYEFLNGGIKGVCPVDSQVGVISPGVSDRTNSLGFEPGIYRTPLYNLEAPGGNTGIVARLGFIGAFYPIYIDVRLDPKRDNALTAGLSNITSLISLTASNNTLWGVPTDESHDDERFNWFEAAFCAGQCYGIPVDSGLEPTPFMVNPTSCGPAQVGTAIDTYQRLGADADLAALPDITGCDAVPFAPTMSVEPTTRSAAASSGLDASLHIPQDGLTDVDALATSHLKEARVTLPEGFTLNSSAADGLGSCDVDQIGLDRNERQIVEIGGKGPEVAPQGAPVQLSFGGQSTQLLPQRASAAQVQVALESLPNVGAGDLSVSGRLGGPWTVDFHGSMAGQDVPTIGGIRSELQLFGVNVGEKGEGTYKLQFEGEETDPLPHDATTAEVQEALDGLGAIGPNAVDVISIAIANDTGGPIFRLVFGGPLAQADLPAVTLNSSLKRFNGEDGLAVTKVLADGGPITTETVQQGGTIRFDGDKPACPESAKVATGEISTPVLSEPLRADFYLAKQQDNPYGSLFAGYLVARGAGALIKVPARIDVDPATGQITTTFTNNPQQPFEDLTLHFKGGDRGLITTPSRCGSYETTYELTPWSGGPPVKGSNQFKIDQNCGDKPFAPGFRAGSETAVGGAFTTFATQITRNAGSPPLTGVKVDMPPGVTGQLAGIPRCPDAALAGVPTATGTGAGELASGSCPAASQVGTVTAGLGSGRPFFVKTGKVFLAGPYKAAPLSLAVIAPAVAGPFDLGNVLVRVPVTLDRATAQVHAVSDPIPTSLEGVPLDLRDLRVLLDRQGFMLNPTDCSEKAVTGTLEGAGGASAQVSDRFQVGECAALQFKPRLQLRLKGGTKRGDNPALTAILRPRAGDANIAGISVTLPHSAFLDQSHIGTVCTRVQFAADACPARSIYGKVTARTPLLDEPLKGNVYLRSSDNELPDLVTDLRGPASTPLRLEAVGRIDSLDGRLRTVFEFVPDAPLDSVVLRMYGGKKGLIDNSRDICVGTVRASASFTAHNGRQRLDRPKVVPTCRKGKHGKGRNGRGG